MLSVHIGLFETLMIAILLIYFGEFISNKMIILKNWCIPSAVIGGTFFSVCTCFAFYFQIVEFKFDFQTMNTFFYNIFFASVGLSASLSFIKKGGKLVGIFIFLAALLAALQNILALVCGYFMNMNVLTALMAGSISLTGGHGNASSFAPIAQQMGGSAAVEVSIAAATFGLISGCLMGGPLGRRLIRKYHLDKNYTPNDEKNSHTQKIQNLVSSKRSHQAAFILLLSCGLGELFFVVFKELFPSINLPLHVMSMLSGIIIRFILDYKKQEQKEKDALYESIDIIGSISLSIFVSLSVMTMKLYELADLALPLIVILVLQLVLMYLFAVFITFRACGKNYDGAIIAVGHTGFGLGAVPVSMATMNSVCSSYHYSKIAFFIVPLVGGFVSNITNALIITIFLNIAKNMT